MHEEIYRDNLETAQVIETTTVYTWSQIDEVMRQCAENKRLIEALRGCLGSILDSDLGNSEIIDLRVKLVYERIERVEELISGLRTGIVIIGFSVGLLGSAFLMHLFWGT